MTASVPDGFRHGYARILEWVVSALVIALAVEVTVGVVFRFIGHSLAWYDELASVMLAWLTFYGAALASLKRAHIGCPELVDALPWRWRRALGILVQLLVIAFFVLLGSVGAWIMPVLATDAMTSLPQVPMSVVQSVIPISSLLIVVAEGLHLVDLLRRSEPAPAGAPAGSEALQ
ncbi:MAG TPA: TRAP transporter small permease [Casimicrobiaceae bacterium]|nr:TRAP transporter small permease [Casimicrobiaceae bacterium]